MNELMTKVIEMINLEPGKWNQSSWVVAKDDTDPMCGTTCCVAGWAMLLSGEAEQKIWIEETEDGAKYVQDVQLIWKGSAGDDWEVLTEGDFMHHGARLLDLDSDQAHKIFMFTNTRDPQVMTNHIKGVLDGRDTHSNEDDCTC